MQARTLKQPDVDGRVDWIVRGRSTSLVTLLQQEEAQGWMPSEFLQTPYNGSIARLVIHHRDEPLLSKEEKRDLNGKYGLRDFSGRVVYISGEYLFLVPDFKELAIPHPEVLRPLLVPLQ